MDKEEVVKEKLDELVDMCRGLSYASFMTAVENANDIIALLKEQEEIRHGEWKWSHGGECSECGYRNSNFDYKYCPMCGAMMGTTEVLNA